MQGSWSLLAWGISSFRENVNVKKKKEKIKERKKETERMRDKGAKRGIRSIFARSYTVAYIVSRYKIE